MNKHIATVITSSLLVCFMGNSALCEESSIDHRHHSHDTTGLELGFSAGYVHLDGENEDAPGLHAHLSKRFV